MSHLVIIREYRQNDEHTIREVVRGALLSLVTDSFISTLTKEITFQLIVVTAAIMFILVGVPLAYCLAAIPIVIGAIYLCIYASFMIKSVELFQGKPTQCWVAEACEPFFFAQSPEKFSYTIFTEQEIKDKGIDVGSQQRKVVGTVAINKHQLQDNAAFLYRLAVNKRYRHKGIGNSLMQAALNWSKVRGYDMIEMSITEIHDTARQLATNLGFQVRQIYHKQILGNALTILKYQLGQDLLPDL